MEKEEKKVEKEAERKMSEMKNGEKNKNPS